MSPFDPRVQVCNLNPMFDMVDYVVNRTKRYYPNKLWVQVASVRSPHWILQQLTDYIVIVILMMLSASLDFPP